MVKKTKQLGDSSRSNRVAKRLAFYEQGVRAFNLTTGQNVDAYYCPICLEPFSRAALDAGQLTFEHVPTRSAGGRELCLTCRRCNSEGGHQVDYAVAEVGRYRALREAFEGHATELTVNTKVHFGDVQLNGELRFDANGVVSLDVRQNRNSPEKFFTQAANLHGRVARRERDIQFGVTSNFRFGVRTLLVSLLRSAYVAAFSLYGYHYILRSELEVVRQQIRRPRDLLVPNAALAIDPNSFSGIDEPIILHQTEPLESVLVFFPRESVNNAAAIVVMLPPPDGQPGFYDRLSTSYTGAAPSRSIAIVAKGGLWPAGPAFIADFAKRVA